MEQNEINDILLKAIYDALGNQEKMAVKLNIEKKLQELNKDTKTHGTFGATQVANAAEKLTGSNYFLGNGFN